MGKWTLLTEFTMWVLLVCKFKTFWVLPNCTVIHRRPSQVQLQQKLVM